MSTDPQKVGLVKRAGRRALIAGIIIIVMMVGVWIWVDSIFAGNSSALANPSAMQFLGKLNVSFALLVVAGVLGVVNGRFMLRTGQRNIPLIIAILVVFAIAIFTSWFAVDAYQAANPS